MFDIFRNCFAYLIINLLINASGILITLVLCNLPTKIISLVDADCRPIEIAKKYPWMIKTLEANVLLLLSLWKFSVLYAACPAKLSVQWFSIEIFVLLFGLL